MTDFMHFTGNPKFRSWVRLNLPSGLVIRDKIRLWASICMNKIGEIVFDCLVDSCAKKPEDFFFIQIGAHDGVSGDPIHGYIERYKWKGILVEPVKYLFDKLKMNYKEQSGLIFENVAIGDKAGTRDLYRLKDAVDDAPAWYDQLGSFYSENVLKHKNTIPDIEEHLVVEKVNCIAFKELLQKYDVKDVKLLQIDVEGYDYEILKTIDFSVFKPKIIRYENKHLSSADKKESAALLKANGYFVMNIAEDTLAFTVV